MTRSNLHKYTVARTMHEQNMVSDAVHEPRRWWKKKEERRRGRWGYRFDTPTPWWRPEEWPWDRVGPLTRDQVMEKNKIKQKLFRIRIQMDQFSPTLQFIFRNSLYWKKKKKKGAWAKRRKPWQVMYDWLDPSLRRPSSEDGDGVKAVCVNMRYWMWLRRTATRPPVGPERPRPQQSPNRRSRQEIRTSTGWRQAQI